MNQQLEKGRVKPETRIIQTAALGEDEFNG
jgi:hypothetical protein